MPPKVSPIWEYFEEDETDPSVAHCKVSGCKKSAVSRGKSGTPRSSLTTTSLITHVFNRHPNEYRVFLQSKNEVAAEKRKRDANDDDDEMESSTVPIFNLRAQGQRQKILQQQSISAWVGGEHSAGQAAGSTYDIQD